MAIRFPAIGDGLSRDGSFLDPALDWTKARWVRVTVLPTSYVTIWQLGGGPPTFSPPYLAGLAFPGPDLIESLGNTGAGDVSDTGIAFLVDLWLYVATRYQASTQTVSTVANGVDGAGAFTLDLSAVAPLTAEVLGTDTASDAGLAVAYDRSWQAWLSLADLAAEQGSTTAVRTSNLLSDTPLSTATDLADRSGHGQTWTVLGSAVTTSGPFSPVVPGPLLTNLGVAGVDGSFGGFASFTAVGVKLGQIDFSAAYEQSDEDGTGVTVVPQVNRIFIRAHRLVDDTEVLLVYDGSGVLLASPAPIDRDATITRVSPALLSQANGTCWISIDTASVTAIWEYDRNGVFVRVVCAVTISGVPSPIGSGLARAPSGLVYFIALADVLVYVLDPDVVADAVGFFAVPPATNQVNALALTPNGLLLLAMDSEVSNAVSRYRVSDGVLLHTDAAYPAPSIIGLAAAGNNLDYWVGQRFTNSVDALIWSVRLSDGARFSFSATITAALDAAGGLSGGLTIPATTTREAIRFVRRFPFPSDKQLRLFLQRLEFTFQRGVGLATGQGDDPQAMLRISRDGGMTWGPERFLTMGAMGEYVTRMFTTRLGQFRNGVIEIAVSDPVIVAFLDCLADVDEGTS